MSKEETINSFEEFQNSPIIISIIQFRYKKIEDLNVAEITKAGEKLKGQYPRIQKNDVQGIRYNENTLTGETSMSLDNRFVAGMVFISDDYQKIISVEQDKTSLEIHGNYIGWENFEKEGKKMWDTFSTALKDVELVGLSLRFINRINLPQDFGEVSDFFTTYIKSEVDTHYNAFQMKYRYTFTEKNVTIHIAHAVETRIEDNVPYIFDIDVIYHNEIVNDSEIIWKKFTDLRIIKNSVFTQGLTEKAKNLIR